MRVLVVTTVHHPLDARIRTRQIRSILRNGWQVTFVAPAGDGPPEEGLDRVVIPRSVGLRRARALFGAAREVWRHSEAVDVALVHDPELLLLAWLAKCPVVFDIHEDVSKQMVDKGWLPSVVRPVMARALRYVDRRLGAMPLIVAEESYLERHPSASLVRNSFDFSVLPAPPPRETTRNRVVYLGAVTEQRGAKTLEALASDLPDGLSIEVIGPVLPDLDGALPTLEGLGALRGRQPLDEGLLRVSGALAGLCLLQDRPNYRNSVPTKVLEYMACGVPVVTTPLPHAVRLVEASGAGVVVPFDDPDAVREACEDLLAHPEQSKRMGERGRQYSKQYFDWTQDEERLMELLNTVATAQHVQR